MNLKISCIQNDVIARNPEANRRHLDEMLKTVENTDIIVFPETFTTGFPADPNEFAEEIGGTTMQWMEKIAREKNCAVCGTIILKNNGFYNSFIWMEPDGKYYLYNKRHLFTMGGEIGLNRGEERITIEYKGWRIRPFVCYDMRFPVWNRNSFKDGKYEYDLAIFTAEWPEKKSEVWNTLLRARAIENQAYIVGVNRVGIDDSDIKYRGETMILNMKGRVVAQASEGECVVNGEINMEELTAFRNYFIVANDWD
ncbi:MAG: nitrilase family protein [Bacteroidales bacterium]|nr:nitrilase family protein [Bacteroidales bacterium]